MWFSMVSPRLSGFNMCTHFALYTPSGCSTSNSFYFILSRFSFPMVRTCADLRNHRASLLPPACTSRPRYRGSARSFTTFHYGFSFLNRSAACAAAASAAATIASASSTARWASDAACSASACSTPLASACSAPACFACPTWSGGSGLGLGPGRGWGCDGDAGMVGLGGLGRDGCLLLVCAVRVQCTCSAHAVRMMCVRAACVQRACSVCSACMCMCM